MKSFKHINVKSLKEASKLLKEYTGKAKVIAGGTDLLETLKDKILMDYPEALINIKTVPGLDYIKEDAKGLKMGALTTLSEVARSPVMKEKYKILAEAAYAVATPQIRNIGTIGGNLCQDIRCWYYRYPHQLGGRFVCSRKGSGPCYAVKGDNRYHAIMGGKKCYAICPSDTAVALAALDAQIKIVGLEGERWIAVTDLFDTLGNALRCGEMVAEIKVPRVSDSAKQTFFKFTMRAPLDFAVVSVATVVSFNDGNCTDARIVLGAVAAKPVRAKKAEEAIIGGPINQETAVQAAELAVAEAKPLSMNAYKVEIAKALIRRAIQG
jgi:xanthine dehydrogenase YagS FAD-binding subunit